MLRSLEENEGMTQIQYPERICLVYPVTESGLASELEGQNVSVALALSAYRNICSTIIAFGSIHRKEKYLPFLAPGVMKKNDVVLV